jgi:hypothetical protein
MKERAEEDHPSNGESLLTIVILGHHLIGWSYV